MTEQEFVDSQMAVVRAQRLITEKHNEEMWRDEFVEAYKNIDWTPIPEPEPTEDWQDLENFLNALYKIVPAEKVVTVLQNPEDLKNAVTALALLTSNAAPNGAINLMDERVIGFAGLVGTTVPAIKEAMQK